MLDLILLKADSVFAFTDKADRRSRDGCDVEPTGQRAQAAALTCAEQCDADIDLPMPDDRVKGWFADSGREGRAETYEGLTCLVCGQIHFVNRHTSVWWDAGGPLARSRGRLQAPGHDRATVPPTPSSKAGVNLADDRDCRVQV